MIKLTESFFFSLPQNIIDGLTKNLGRELSRQDIQALAKEYLIAIAEGKDYKDSKELLTELKMKKLGAEILKLDIDNQLRLMRELKFTPEEITKVLDGSLDITDAENADKDKLSPSQWDHVYGCLIEGFATGGKKQCLACGVIVSDDKDGIKHLTEKHSENIKKAIQGMGYKIG